MLYLNQDALNTIGIDWPKTADLIGRAIGIYAATDFAQPIKPYLRYGNPANRIIAMPAFIGGDIQLAGIKWIASFPGNLARGIARAHAVIILNEADTGVPLCVIGTAQISAIRTAGVSGWLLGEWLAWKQPTRGLRVGICGFGPIGQHHLSMIGALLHDQLEAIYLYDRAGIDTATLPTNVPGGVPPNKVVICDNWQQAYADADVFITCTVSAERYIDLPPKPGSLHLNVSLRDYQATFLRYVTRVIVDSWEEVCRQDTDVERMHLEMGLQQADTLAISEVRAGELRDVTDPDAVFMFNPMGMALFDIAVAGHYYSTALAQGVGLALT